MKLLNCCPICKSNQIAPYSMKFQLDFPHLSRTICKDCKIVFANPVSTEEELNTFYTNYYDKGNFGALQYKQKIKATFEQINTTALDQLGQFDKNVNIYSGEGNYLDVGFGLGIHLFIANQFGYKLFGTELDNDCIHFVKELIPSAELFHGDLIAATYPSNHFDMVNVCHVIEHLLDPIVYIQEVKRISKPGAIAIISTPNINALPYRIFRILNFLNFKIPLIVDGLEHTVIFNKTNLANLFTANGFEVLTQFSESVNDSFSNIWKSNLSLRKKIVRYCQTFVKINQVLIVKKL